MNFNAFLESLPIMGKGMAAIFIVILLIMFSTMGINKVFSEFGGKKKDE